MPITTGKVDSIEDWGVALPWTKVVINGELLILWRTDGDNPKPDELLERSVRLSLANTALEQGIDLSVLHEDSSSVAQAVALGDTSHLAAWFGP